MKIAIYGLQDPRNMVVRYVGQTDNVYRRFIEHIGFSQPKYPKDFWIQELKDLNFMVLMPVLQRVDDKYTADKREAYWINHYGQLAAEANFTIFNRFIPLDKTPVPTLPIEIEEAELLLRLRDIPGWEKKLVTLERVIGSDRREVWHALFQKAPGGASNTREVEVYNALLEAYRYRYRQLKEQAQENRTEGIV